MFISSIGMSSNAGSLQSLVKDALRLNHFMTYTRAKARSDRKGKFADI